MALDASFEKVENVHSHPNADKLDMCEIGGYPVVIGKNQFKNGDIVFYIREDAQLIGDIQRFPWQANALKYASGSGRIKVVKLRGEFSSGLTIPVSEVYAHISDENSKNWEEDNRKIHSENGVSFLLGKFGIKHFELPLKNIGINNIIGELPYSIPKSDEENFQKLSNIDRHYGEKALITKKLDGTSCTLVSLPNGKIHICSRSYELDPNCDNIYTRATKDVIPLIQSWSKYYNKPIALRGEVCARTIQKMSFNKDKDVPFPTFFLYGTFMIDEFTYENRYGLYGSRYHFLNIANDIKQLTGISINTVPILGESIITDKLFETYLHKPLSFGEGIVINTKYNHYKCKSMEYLAELSKHY